MSGRTALRLLDAVIAQQIPGNERLLAEWKAVKRVPRKSGTTLGEDAKATATAAATATPGAAPTPTTHVATAAPTAA